MSIEEALSQTKLLTESDPKNAIIQWDRLVEQYPDNEEVRLGKAECHRSIGETSKAIVVYEALLKEKPSSLGALVGLGQIALNDANWTKVEEIFRTISLAFENVPWAFVHQASACYYLGKPENALLALKRGLKQNDKSDIILDKLVQTLCDIGRGQQALDTFKQIVADNLATPERQEQLASRVASVFLNDSEYPKTAFDLDESLLAFFRYDPTRRRK